MKNMIKVSKLFNRKIAQVTSQVYRKFVQLNTLAQTLVTDVDIYDGGDAAKRFSTVAQSLSQKCLLAADKIYRKGMSAYEMRSVLSSITAGLSILEANKNGALSDSSTRVLTAMKSMVAGIIPVDVPAQNHVGNALSRIEKNKDSKPEAGASKVKKLVDDDAQNMSYQEDRVSPQMGDDEGPNMSVDTTLTSLLESPWTPGRYIR